MRDPQRSAYRQQLRNAKRRNIEFRLTFEEWLAVWVESSHLDERGLGGYVMARENDRGPYAVGNVKIITQRDNNTEFFSRKTPEEVRRWKDGLNSHTPEAEIKRGASVRKVRSEKYWSCSPTDPNKREQWIANLRQSQLNILSDPAERARRARNFQSRK
ncbi:MAG TPA: hypothetical protein VN903_35410 [Polyangia bacterium]|nr:hypothetical protein [Polyangia bacterium]